MPVDAASLSKEKALAMAIKSEQEAEALYARLDSQVRNFVMKEKLRFLVNEEKKHQQMLQELFRKLFPGRTPASDRSITPRVALTLGENPTVPDLLELAMDAEKEAEEFYDALSLNVEERGLQDILQYLASMEHGHYFLLKGEYELCQKDEAYYERDAFHYDMVHLGP
jgi:rubrerythrin